jgi:hypothetical protein
VDKRRYVISPDATKKDIKAARKPRGPSAR